MKRLKRRETVSIAVDIEIDWLGGNCPVQAEGRINNQPFYFRARGDEWSLRIGGDEPVSNPEWRYEEPYGQWPDAGWMTEDEARAFIKLAAEKFDALSHLR
jgi:hypothetical protein